jgi:hypothetical protein
MNMNKPYTGIEADRMAWFSKGKAIPVTSHEGPQGCETSRLSHFQDNRLTKPTEDAQFEVPIILQFLRARTR